MARRRHSESVLSDLRDGWWSRDYLELIAERLQLDEHRRVLDVGCGHGHWGIAVLSLVNERAELVGIDQEADWVAKATDRSRALGVGERCRFEVGNAIELPYPAGSFDLVTCQTLLMHVARPRDVLREMMRVLEPGGRLLVAEPSNLANQFSTDTVHRALSPRELSELAYLFVCCSRGRTHLGRGDDSIADVLPGMLSELGLQELRVFQNERPSIVTPPYRPEVRALLEEELARADRRFWLWDEHDARVLFEAGGGEAARFDEAYRIFTRRTGLFREQVAAGTYARTGGAHHYIITGARRAQ